MKTDSFDHILIETPEDGIVTLTINRPDKLNALNSTVLNELEQAISSFEKSRDFGVMIITGAGEKAFVAGADIKELSALDRTRGEKASARGQHICSLIENSSKPVIAVVNGYALGGGAELAMACHLRYASEKALIGLPEVTLGIIPGYGGTQRLPLLVGKANALEMILTGQPVKAEKAEAIGLVNKVLPANEVMGQAKKTASKILNNGPLALSKAINAVNRTTTDGGYAKEAELFGQLCDTDDFKEGTSAFLEKRKAKFRGN